MPTIAELSSRSREVAAAHGFSTPEGLYQLDERNLMLGKLMLVVTEISEAAEAVRRRNFANFQEELADATIRIFDICGACKIDLEAEVVKKLEVNQQRPYQHGKQCSL